VETVIKRQGFTDTQQAVLHNNGPETEIGYRLAWARSYLKGMSLLTNSARGIWALTDEGTALVTDPTASDSQRRERVHELWQAHLVVLREARKTRPRDDADPDAAELAEEPGWKEQLLDQLMHMPPETGSAWSASRSSSSAKDTGAAQAQARSATSAARWQAGGTRAC
jgi:restriction system protein